MTAVAAGPALLLAVAANDKKGWQGLQPCALMLHCSCTCAQIMGPSMAALLLFFCKIRIAGGAPVQSFSFRSVSCPVLP